MLEIFPGFFSQIKSNILVPTKVVMKLAIAILAGRNLAIFLFSSISLVNQLNNILKYTSLVFLAWLVNRRQSHQGSRDILSQILPPARACDFINYLKEFSN